MLFKFLGTHMSIFKRFLIWTLPRQIMVDAKTKSPIIVFNVVQDFTALYHPSFQLYYHYYHTVILRRQE
jgi:hypothetical protein